MRFWKKRQEKLKLLSNLNLEKIKLRSLFEKKKSNLHQFMRMISFIEIIVITSLKNRNSIYLKKLKIYL